MSGLLGSINDGLREFFAPTSVPQGALYSPNDLGQTRIAGIGQLGMGLLAASQGGQSHDNRARILAQTGDAFVTMPALLTQRGANNVQALNVGVNSALRLQELEIKRREQEWLDSVLPRLAGVGGNAAPAGLAGAAGAAAQPTPPASLEPTREGLVWRVPSAWTDRVVGVESGGDPNARNPRSTATGSAQFLDGTWLRFAQENPAFFDASLTQRQILDRRSDPALQRRAAEWYANANARELTNAGLPVNANTLFLSHSFGAGGAMALLRAAQQGGTQPAVDVLGRGVIDANPELRGLDVNGVLAVRLGRFTGQGLPGVQPVAGQPGGAPLFSPDEVPFLRGLGARGVGQAVIQRSEQRRGEALQQWTTISPEDLPADRRPTVRPGDIIQRRGDGEIRVIQRPENPLETNLARIDANRITTLQEANSAAQEQLTALGVVRQSLESGANTGITEVVMGPLRRVAVGVGLGSVFPEWQQIANANQLFEAMVARLVPAQRAAGSGAMSDRDLEMYERSLPSIRRDQAGNLVLTAILQRVAERTIEGNRIREEEIRAGRASRADQVARQRLGDMFTTVSDPAQFANLRAGDVVAIPDAFRGSRRPDGTAMFPAGAFHIVTEQDIAMGRAVAQQRGR